MSYPATPPSSFLPPYDFFPYFLQPSLFLFLSCTSHDLTLIPSRTALSVLQSPQFRYQPTTQPSSVPDSHAAMPHLFLFFFLFNSSFFLAPFCFFLLVSLPILFVYFDDLKPLLSLRAPFLTFTLLHLSSASPPVSVLAKDGSSTSML